MFDPAGKRQKLFAHEMIFHFYSERAFELILFQLIDMLLPRPEVYEVYRLLQTGLFLTDSVFVELVACFDETMDSIRGY